MRAQAEALKLPTAGILPTAPTTCSCVSSMGTPAFSSTFASLVPVLGFYCVQYHWSFLHASELESCSSACGACTRACTWLHSSLTERATKGVDKGGFWPRQHCECAKTQSKITWQAKRVMHLMWEQRSQKGNSNKAMHSKIV
eukprot:4364113-Pleurochrysis_carterae.AAC.14